MKPACTTISGRTQCARSRGNPLLFVNGVVGAQSPLLEAILTMARGLRLRTVAEGVEKIGQLDFLRRHGCDEVQGHFFSHAMEGCEMRRSVRETIAAAA